MDTPSIPLFFGRLHVAAVHFPIALLVVAALFEAVALLRRRGAPCAVARALCLPAVLAALIAAATGWTLAEREAPGASLDETLFRHRWLGVAALAAATAAAWLARGPREAPRSPAAFRAVLFLSAALVSVTGHLGGSLVHGEDYLSAPLFGTPTASAAPTGPAGAPPPTALADAAAAAPLPAGPDFLAEVAPLFAARCSECHGSARAKGRLRFDQRESVLERPANRTIVVPGDPEGSVLLARVRLPADDPDRMPPEGDPLTPEQIETLRAWIEHGAVWNAPP